MEIVLPIATFLVGGLCGALVTMTAFAGTIATIKTSLSNLSATVGELKTKIYANDTDIATRLLTLERRLQTLEDCKK